MTENPWEAVAPQVLEAELENEKDIRVKINNTAKTIIRVLDDMGNWHDVSTIRNIIQTLISQQLILDRLLSLYKEIYGINKRLKALMRHENFSEEYKENIQKRASEIVNKQVFSLQREMFFKIVNAKQVVEGEKNEDGPALLFPGIERLKTEILSNIQAQTQQLKPVALDMCKTFRGIADEYAATELVKIEGDGRYVTISQSYDLEKQIYEMVQGDVSVTKISDTSFMDDLIRSFADLKNSYQKKIKSLKVKESSNVTNFDLKVKILEEGVEEAERRVSPLRILRSLSKRLPALADQMDYFAESHYQAKAVMKFLEEVKDEMSRVFHKHDFESFTVISLLKFKLNGTSHMYQAIYYYYALVQIEEDISNSLKNKAADTHRDLDSHHVDEELEKIGISQIVEEMHSILGKLNECNHAIHTSFIAYKEKSDINKLKSTLKIQTKLINNMHAQVKSLYQNAQQLFFSFLEDDLGAFDFSVQFSNCLAIHKDNQEAIEIRRSFDSLVSSRKQSQRQYELDFKRRFEQKLDPKKISAMAALKVKIDFQKDILTTIQKQPIAQGVFVDILKEFIKVQKRSEKGTRNDFELIRMVKERCDDEIGAFLSMELPLIQRLLKKEHLTEREMIVSFLASNITLHEIENFSRLIPGLPRNELQLDSPYGRFLLDIKSIFDKRLRYNAASGDFIIEKIFEKRERLKLVNKICEFLLHCARPSITRIDNEEKKLDSLISLERRKYQKDLNQVIQYWQYLVQDQIVPGQGKRGRFRKYKPDDLKVLVRHISPEQLDLIDKNLESSYDLKHDTRLFEVESFLMSVASALIESFKTDLRIRAQFENHEVSKRIKTNQQQKVNRAELLNANSFVPNIRRRIHKIELISGGSKIEQFLKYWEFLIDQHVPVSERRKKPKAPKMDLVTNGKDISHYITVELLQAIHEDLKLLQTIRDQQKQKQLAFVGLPILKLIQGCLQLYKNEATAQKTTPFDKNTLSNLVSFCKNPDFQENAKTAFGYLKKRNGKT